MFFGVSHMTLLWEVQRKTLKETAEEASWMSSKISSKKKKISKSSCLLKKAPFRPNLSCMAFWEIKEIISSSQSFDNSVIQGASLDWAGNLPAKPLCHSWFAWWHLSPFACRSSLDHRCWLHRSACRNALGCVLSHKDFRSRWGEPAASMKLGRDASGEEISKIYWLGATDYHTQKQTQPSNVVYLRCTMPQLRTATFQLSARWSKDVQEGPSKWPFANYTVIGKRVKSEWAVGRKET